MKLAVPDSCGCLFILQWNSWLLTALIPPGKVLHWDISKTMDKNLSSVYCTEAVFRPTISAHIVFLVQKLRPSHSMGKVNLSPLLLIPLVGDYWITEQSSWLIILRMHWRNLTGHHWEDDGKWWYSFPALQTTISWSLGCRLALLSNNRPLNTPGLKEFMDSVMGSRLQGAWISVAGIENQITFIPRFWLKIFHNSNLFLGPFLLKPPICSWNMPDPKRSHDSW